MLGRRIAAGFLSGTSIPVGLLLLLVLSLFASSLFSLVWSLLVGLEGEVSFRSALGLVLAGTLGRLPGYLWNARWLLLAMGPIGALLAVADGQRCRLRRPWSA